MGRRRAKPVRTPAAVGSSLHTRRLGGAGRPVLWWHAARRGRSGRRRLGRLLGAAPVFYCTGRRTGPAWRAARPGLGRRVDLVRRWEAAGWCWAVASGGGEGRRGGSGGALLLGCSVPCRDEFARFGHVRAGARRKPERRPRAGSHGILAVVTCALASQSQLEVLRGEAWWSTLESARRNMNGSNDLHAFGWIRSAGLHRDVCVPGESLGPTLSVPSTAALSGVVSLLGGVVVELIFFYVGLGLSQ